MIQKRGKNVHWEIILKKILAVLPRKSVKPTVRRAAEATRPISL